MPGANVGVAEPISQLPVVERPERNFGGIANGWGMECVDRLSYYGIVTPEDYARLQAVLESEDYEVIHSWVRGAHDEFCHSLGIGVGEEDEDDEQGINWFEIEEDRSAFVAGKNVVIALAGKRVPAGFERRHLASALKDVLNNRNRDEDYPLLYNIALGFQGKIRDMLPQELFV